MPLLTAATVTPARVALVGLAVIGVLSVSACTSDDNDATPTASPGPLVGVPELNPSQRVDLITRLKAIDKGLVADETLAITRARFVCKKVIAGDSDAVVQAYVLEQFVGGRVTGLTEDGVAGITAAVQASFCPKP